MISERLTISSGLPLGVFILNSSSIRISLTFTPVNETFIRQPVGLELEYRQLALFTIMIAI